MSPPEVLQVSFCIAPGLKREDLGCHWLWYWGGVCAVPGAGNWACNVICSYRLSCCSLSLQQAVLALLRRTWLQGCPHGHKIYAVISTAMPFYCLICSCESDKRQLNSLAVQYMLCVVLHQLKCTMLSGSLCPC